MRRKAQAAMEFLMTYGWAILVVLAAIGALAYLGILNPANWVSGRCDLQSDLRCSGDVVRAGNNIYFEVLTSEDISIIEGNYTETGSTVVCPLLYQTGTGTNVTVDGASFVGGRSYLFSMDCTAGANPGTLQPTTSGDLLFTYTKGGINVPRQLSGGLVNIK